MSYLDLTIKEIHEALVNKKVTPLELVKEAIDRIKNDDNNAIEYLMENEAIAMAENIGEIEPDNLLWGIPFAIKDNISTKDVPTCASSKILEGYVPIYNATIVEKLINLKAIPVAKTTLDELAMGGTGSTGHLGKTFNPYDKTHTRMIGGSSCGSASIVASGNVPFSIGSDTGDSIRKPASYGGLVGLKPTWGRISRFGLFPFAPSLDTLGFFTRSVDDLAILLQAVAGHDEKDFTSSIKLVDDYISCLNEDVKDIKIAVVDEIVNSISDKLIIEKFNKVLDVYASKGAIINHVHLDTKMLKTLFSTYYIISCAEATSNNANLDGIKFGKFYQADNYIDTMKQARTNGFSERIKRRFIIGSYSLMKENVDELFNNACRNRRLIVDSFNKVLEDADIIIAPAAPSIAAKFDNKIDQLENEYLIADNFMVYANFAGLPSVTVPMGLIDNMPVGVNMSSKPFTEKRLFQIAKVLEDSLGLKNLSIRTFKNE